MTDVFNFQLSDVITNDLLKKYVAKGWEGLSDGYKKSGKEIEPESVADFDNKSKLDKSIILKILGALREYIVDRIFKKAQGKDNEGNNEYFAAGSTNLTSDYDLAVSGPQANEIIWDMFKMFLKHYQQALPRAFDTNLYSSPLYIHTTKGNGEKLSVRKASKPTKKDSLSGFPRVNYNGHGNRQFTLIPQTEDEMNEELDWAGMKLLHKVSGDHYDFYDDEKQHGKLMEILKRSKILKTHLMKECDALEKPDTDFTELIKKKDFKFLNEPGKNIKETRNIFKNYYMQYKAQEKCQKYVYENKDLAEKDIESVNGKEKRNIFYYSNKANYYASEAYYTSSAVNAVVVENQLGGNLDYTGRENYLVRSKIAAALEQIGDMTHHIEHKGVDDKDDDSLKKIIIKFSKYIYRFWYILGTIGADTTGYENKFKKLAEKINEKIIPIRAKYNIKDIGLEDWKLMDVNGKVLKAKGKEQIQAKKDWLKILRADMLKEIEKLLNQKGERKKKKRTKKKQRKKKRKKTKRKKY